MSLKNKNSKVFTIVSAIICVILSFVLISNVIIIIKGAVNPERPPSVFGVTSMIVLSGSMSGNEPGHIEVGDLIVTKSVDPETLKVGDVITFMEQGTTTVTHRIIAINNDGTFKTKGDANNAEDKAPVQHEDIVGKYVFRIPKLGDVAMFAQTPFGMMVFIGIPLLAYILLDIAVRSKHNKKKKKADEEAKEEADKLKEELERLKAQLSEKEEN